VHRQGRRSSGVKLGEGPVSLTKRQWSRQAPSRVFPRLVDSSILSIFTLTPDLPFMSTSLALLLWPLHCQRFSHLMHKTIIVSSWETVLHVFAVEVSTSHHVVRAQDRTSNVSA